MNLNEYFKSVSYESIQTVFIMKQISSPLDLSHDMNIKLSCSLSCSNHLFNRSNAFMSLTGSTWH